MPEAQRALVATVQVLGNVVIWVGIYVLPLLILAMIPLGLLLWVARYALVFAIIGSQILPPLLNLTATKAPVNYGAPESVGVTLFALYAWPLELIGFLLLIGIVGSILLAKRRF